jgi:AcrR family transcriptional regulator
MRADARRNYDRLLAEAAAAFAERGSDEASLEEIARRADVGIGTLYRHFPTRPALLEAVYRDQVDALATLAEQLGAADEPGSALAQWMAAVTAFGSTKRSLSASLLETLGKDSELFSMCSTMLRATTTALLERAQQAGVARADVDGQDLLRLLHGLMLACPTAPGSADQIERMLSMVVAGVLTEPVPA